MLNSYENTRQKKSYHSEAEDPGSTPPSSDGSGPWKESGPHGDPFPTTADGFIWHAKKNVSYPFHIKFWTIELSGKSADKYSAESLSGYVNGAPPTKVPVAVSGAPFTSPGPPKKKNFIFVLFPQPDWEVVKFKRNADFNGSGPVYIKPKSYSFCVNLFLMANLLTMNDAFFGVPAEDFSRITEFSVFPIDGVFDPNGEQTMTAPPGTGHWSWTPVHASPYRNAYPGGGVRWSSDGAGLNPDDHFQMTMAMQGAASASYDMFALNANSGDFQNYKIRVNPPSAIPTLSQWGIIIFGFALLTAGTFYLRRRRMLLRG